MKTDEVETKWNSLHGETEKSFFGSGKSLALNECWKFCLCGSSSYVNLSKLDPWKKQHPGFEPRAKNKYKEGESSDGEPECEAVGVVEELTLMLKASDIRRRAVGLRTTAQVLPVLVCWEAHFPILLWPDRPASCLCQCRLWSVMPWATPSHFPACQ